MLGGPRWHGLVFSTFMAAHSPPSHQAAFVSLLTFFKVEEFFLVFFSLCLCRLLLLVCDFGEVEKRMVERLSSGREIWRGWVICSSQRWFKHKVTYSMKIVNRSPGAGPRGNWPRQKSDWPLKCPCPVFFFLIVTNNKYDNLLRIFICVALLKFIERTVNKESLQSAPYCVRKECVWMMDI